ncbi:MAG TPA: Ig-like domain-containing protein, partial [Bryobacteraceae bacterium]
MSKSIHQLFAAGAVLIFGLLGSTRSLQAAGCSTVAQVTTCTPANGQLSFDDASGKYLPYGTGASSILVSGAGGPVSAVSITLNAVAGTGGTPQRGQHIWAMLVAPNGTTNLVFFGRPCTGLSGHHSFAGQTFTVADSGTATFPGTAGNPSAPCDTLPGSPPAYKPITDDSSTNILFPSPAPTPTYATPGPPATNATFASQFTGITANGTWTLYAAGLHGAGEAGTIGANASSASWSLAITFTNAQGTNTTVASNLNPSFTSGANSLVTLTATVTSGSTVNGGTVTFKDGTNAIACSGGNQTVSGGSATCQFTFPTEGAHVITAAYGGSGSFAASNSTPITQVVNKQTTAQAGPPAGTVGFCNTGAITIPAAGSNGDPSATPASPYASEIFISGQVGIINDIKVYLNSFTSSEPFAEGFMLVSPGGKAYDFLSQAGGGQPFSNFNFIIADSGATQMPDASAPSNNTTYKPSSYTNSATTYCTSAVCNGVTVSEPAPSVFDSAAPRGIKTMLGEFGGLS